MLDLDFDTIVSSNKQKQLWKKWVTAYLIYENSRGDDTDKTKRS